MSRAWRGGSTTAWRRTRAAVLADNRARNGGACTARVSPDCTGVADQVHHTKGRAVTGDDPRYLVAVCRACNLHIGEPGRDHPAPSPKSKW